MSTNKDVDCSVDNVIELKEFLMNFEQSRLESFKDWPFDKDCDCVPVKMAAAGFYHCPSAEEPDLVRCFMCYKELDGWEPTDDPLKEHKSHSPKCPFINLKTIDSEDNITMAGFFRLEALRQQNRIKSHIERWKKEFATEAERTRHLLEELRDQ